MSFLILSLPRSRSAWLAHYLSYPLARPRQPVGHEILNACHNVQQFLDSYDAGMWGTVETGGAPLWPIVRNELPDCRVVLVRRPLLEVYRSLAAAGATPELTFLAELDQHLNAASADPSITSVPYETLSDPGVGRWLFEYCLELEWDQSWWQQMVETHITVDMPAWLTSFESKQEQHKALLADIVRRTPTIH